MRRAQAELAVHMEKSEQTSTNKDALLLGGALVARLAHLTLIAVHDDLDGSNSVDDPSNDDPVPHRFSSRPLVGLQVTAVSPEQSIAKLAPTLLSVFASRLSRTRPQSPQPGSPSSSAQGLPMGQQQSKRTKKNSKDKEKDTESNTPPESIDTKDDTPQGSLSRGTAPQLANSNASPNSQPDSSPQVNITDPDGTTVTQNGSGTRPPGPDGSPSSVSGATPNLPSTNSPQQPSSSPAGSKPIPLDIPHTPTILSNSVTSGLPTPGSTNSFSVGDAGSPANGFKDKNRVVQLDIDDMIQRLLDVGYTGKVSKSLCLKNNEIVAICQAAREVFLSQPTLIELSPPVKIVGDVHGQYSDLIRLFEMCGFPPAANYLFLGDYVDRGKQSLETILLLLCYKIKYPENFFLLRGNHECANVTRGERLVQSNP